MFNHTINNIVRIQTIMITFPLLRRPGLMQYHR